MYIEIDFSIAKNGDIRVRQGVNAGHYRVIELHRWLQRLASSLDVHKDTALNITNSNPSERIDDFLIILHSPYNIEQEVANHLYDGSIVVKEGTKTIEIWEGKIYNEN